MRLWALAGIMRAAVFLGIATLFFIGVVLVIVAHPGPRYLVCQGGGFCMTCKTGESYLVEGNCIKIADTKFCGDYSIEDRRK
jgi:hypothetical protein